MKFQTILFESVCLIGLIVPRCSSVYISSPVYCFVWFNFLVSCSVLSPLPSHFNGIQRAMEVGEGKTFFCLSRFCLPLLLPSSTWLLAWMCLRFPLCSTMGQQISHNSCTPCPRASTKCSGINTKHGKQCSVLIWPRCTRSHKYPPPTIHPPPWTTSVGLFAVCSSSCVYLFTYSQEFIFNLYVCTPVPVGWLHLLWREQSGGDVDVSCTFCV